MSGAANFGAMQAGAVEALFEAGLKPDMMVGTSAGALNAVYLAEDPSPEGARRLQERWLQAGPDVVGVPRPIEALRRLVSQKESVVDNADLRRYLEAHFPPGVDTFEELRNLRGVRVYAVAVELESKRVRVFGDQRSDRLIDGAMASTAVPPYFPPWEVDGKRYLDGGFLSKLPILAALERGARQVVALDVRHAAGSLETARGIIGVATYALSIMMELQTETEIAWAAQSGADVRVIRLQAPADITFWDYTSAGRMIDHGKTLAREALAAEPLRARPEWWAEVRSKFHFGRLRPEDHPALAGKE